MSDGSSESDTAGVEVEHVGGVVAAVTAVAIATTPLAAVGAAASLAQTIASVARPILEKRRRDREQNFLARVAHYLATEDVDAAARFAAGAAETEAFADTLERGYEQIRRAFHPLARECICLLVAHHALAADPGRARGDFVAVGMLLERSDESALVAAEALARLYAGLSPVENEHVFVFVSHSPTGVFLAANRGAPGMRLTSIEHLREEHLRPLFAVMAGAGIGSVNAGFGASPPEGSPSADASDDFGFSRRDHTRMLLLNRCLEPVRSWSAESKAEGHR